MVPKGWSESYLGEVVTYKKGYAFNSSLYAEEGIRIVRISDTTRDSIHSDNPVFIAGGNVEGLEQYSLFENDIILSTVGSRPHLLDSMVGKAVKVPRSAHNSLLNQNLVKLIPKKTKITNEYLFSMLKKKEFIQFISNLVRGNANQVSITLADLFKYKFILPSLPEQKKIAQILSTWDKAISVTEKLLTNSQQQKKALMQQLLTGEKRLLDENGVRFSGDWGKFTLSHFGKCIRGVSYKPENICENESDNTIRLLRSTNIQNGELNDKDLIILPKKLVKPMQVLMDGDLAICMANGSKSLVGKSAPYKPNDADYTVGAFCALFRPLKSVSSSFVKFLFESNQYQSQLLVILAGSSINNLKGSDIESINIDAPLHYKEQQKIAAVLSAADAEISTLEKKLACLRDEKKALMQQLLTGKRRVKVDEAVAV